MLGVRGASYGGEKVQSLKVVAAMSTLTLLFTLYLEGQGDLVSRLIIPITHIVTLNILITNLLTKFP